MSDANGRPLPIGWELRPLSDIADINPPLDRCIIDDDLPVTFVPMRAVEAEGGGLLRPETRSYREVKKGYTSFVSGDVIMAKITPCMENGKTAVVPPVPGDVCFGSTEFHVVRALPGIEPGWIARFLLRHDVRRSAQREMSGAVGQMRVPAAFLESAEIPVPPSREQSRIANEIDEILSDLDDGVAALRRVRARLKSYRTSVLKAAVEGTLTADWRAAHPGVEPASTLLEQILVERRRRWEEEQFAKAKESGREPPKNWKAKYKEPAPPDLEDWPSLPSGWCWVAWPQIGFSQNGRPFPSGEYQDSGTKLLRPGNLYADGAVRWTARNTRFMSDEYAYNHPGAIVGGGELVMNLTAQSLKDDFLGRVCLTSPAERCLLNQRLARLTPVLVDARFMLLMFKATFFRRFVAGLNTGSLIQHMFTSQLDAFLFPLPPSAEQVAIVEAADDQLSVIDHLEADLDAKLESAQALRQSILRHAFTGQLVPQDPNDEPASELLERIACGRAARVDGQRSRRGAASRSRVPKPR